MNLKDCQTNSTKKTQATSSATYSIPVNIEIEHETFGAVQFPKYISTGPSSRPTRDAWGKLASVSDKEVAASAERLMLDIQSIIDTFHKSGIETSTMPTLQVFSPDDGSVLLEWSTDIFKVGLTVEPKADDSGWYFVSSKALGEIAASGFVSEINTKRLVPWLISLVINNA
ncbi:MAG: hypothetical protein FVQ80_15080 [Planctomycetes bacterium]|nr:hypothetical protein [Planctomycetota bacterium]